MPRNGTPVNLSYTADAQLLQDTLQSAGILPNTDISSAVAAFQNAEGQAEAIVIDQSGNVFHACREPLSDSGWNIYGIGAGFTDIGPVDKSTMWALGADSSIWRSDNLRCSQTQTLPSGKPATAISSGRDGTIWAVDSGGTLFVKGAGGSRAVPEVNSSIAPVLMTDAANLLNFFCVDSSGVTWTIRQRASGGSWGTWRSLGTPATGTSVTLIKVGSNQDGRLQVFAIGSDNTVHSCYQQQPSTNWSSWVRLSSQNPTVSDLAVGQNQDGRLEIYAISSSSLFHIWQTSPNNGWSAWTAFGLPEQGPGEVSVVTDSDGCLNFAVTLKDANAVYWAKQIAAGGGWTSPSKIMKVDDPSNPFLMMNEDGHLELLCESARHIRISGDLAYMAREQRFEATAGLGLAKFL